MFCLPGSMGLQSKYPSIKIKTTRWWNIIIFLIGFFTQFVIEPFYDTNDKPVWVIYEGIWTRKWNYIGKMNRIVNFDGKNIQTFEPSRHLKSNLTHAFTWNVLMAVPINDCVRKNLETWCITFSRPSLNE